MECPPKKLNRLDGFWKQLHILCWGRFAQTPVKIYGLAVYMLPTVFHSFKFDQQAKEQKKKKKKKNLLVRR